MAIMVFLGSCGGGPKGSPDTGGIEDAETVSVLETARHAFLAGRYDQAAAVYTRALDRAYRLDDVAAIAVAGQELALSQLRRGKAADAAAVAARTRSELQRRGRSVPPALTLVEATAHYRLGDAQKTRHLAWEITESSKDVLVTARATYLIGLIAADRGDRAALQDAVAKLPALEEPELEADRLALTGRLAVLDGDMGTALAAFTAEEVLRRANGDEAGVIRALESAARAAENGGRLAEAADLYFRAGRSAALARPVGSGAAALLRRAEHLARRTGQPGLASEAGRLRFKLVSPERTVGQE